MRRQALICINGQPAGCLTLYALDRYEITYDPGYAGPAISLILPVRSEPYVFEAFPPFFEGLLPEGGQLEGLLRQAKVDRDDYFSQLIHVGQDLVGAVTVREIVT